MTFDPEKVPRYYGCDVWGKDGSKGWGCDSGDEAGDTEMVMAKDFDTLHDLYTALKHEEEPQVGQNIG